MNDKAMAEVLEALEGLRSEMASMRDRLGALEARQAEVERQLDSDVSPETLAMLAAAVTAFLGKRVRIRSARQVGEGDSTRAWTSFGRAALHSSRLHRQG
ncbi:MAG: hypothetical protein V2I82_08900 [Halieaceae bacterium]|jgi:hypothetical protein|nr:hypothetical protein [Halieaceae bacterium]